MRGRVVQNGSEITMRARLRIQGFVGHSKSFGFYFEWDRSAIRGLRHRSDMIWLISKRIALAAVLRINERRQEWKQWDQVGDDKTLDSLNGLDQHGGSKSLQKSSDSQYVLKVQLSEFSEWREREGGNASYQFLPEQLQIRNYPFWSEK